MGIDFDDEELDDEFDDALDIVTVFDEDGTETDYSVVDSIEENGVKYLLVVETEEEDDEEAEACILKQVGDKDGELVFEDLEDDEEFDRIAAKFRDSDEYEIL